MTRPLGWDVGIEIPAALARRRSTFVVEQHIDFQFVKMPDRQSTPLIEHVRYDRQGRIYQRERCGLLLDQYS